MIAMTSHIKRDIKIPSAFENPSHKHRKENQISTYVHISPQQHSIYNKKHK